MGTCAMSLMSLPRVGAIAAAILVPATLLHAALPTPTDAPEHGSLTGQLLIAAPTMGDPRFQHTVILMVRHDRNGALGIVINRPIGERPLASVLEALGEKDTAVAGQVRIFAGGPVQPEIGFVVHSAEYHRSDTVGIDRRVASDRLMPGPNLGKKDVTIVYAASSGNAQRRVAFPCILRLLHA